MLKRLRHHLRQLGPGLITGAADDDPSGIATYSQAGAQFGTRMLWSLVITLPLMAIQPRQRPHRLRHRAWPRGQYEARLPRPWLLLLVGLLVTANTLNIAADIAAMAEALRLLVGG